MNKILGIVSGVMFLLSGLALLQNYEVLHAISIMIAGILLTGSFLSK